MLRPKTLIVTCRLYWAARDVTWLRRVPLTVGKAAGLVVRAIARSAEPGSLCTTGGGLGYLSDRAAKRRFMTNAPLDAALPPQCLRGLTEDPDADPAHAVEVAEANLEGDLIEGFAGCFDARQRGLAAKALDGTRGRLTSLGGELPGKLTRADPCDVRQLLDR